MMDGKKALFWMLVISCAFLIGILALVVIHSPKVHPRTFTLL
jgi:hypothetical protein